MQEVQSRVEPVIDALWITIDFEGTVRCTNCKTDHSESSKRCPECGAHMHDSSERFDCGLPHTYRSRLQKIWNDYHREERHK